MPQGCGCYYGGTGIQRFAPVPHNSFRSVSGTSPPPVAQRICAALLIFSSSPCFFRYSAQLSPIMPMYAAADIAAEGSTKMPSEPFSSRSSGKSLPSETVNSPSKVLRIASKTSFEAQPTASPSA